MVQTVTLEDEPQTVKAETKDTNKENLINSERTYYGKKTRNAQHSERARKVIEVITLDDWDSDEKYKRLNQFCVQKE